MSVEIVKICDAACDFDLMRHQEVFQPGTDQRRSSDNENGGHAATELLAGDGIPSCTVTRRILV